MICIFDDEIISNKNFVTLLDKENSLQQAFTVVILEKASPEIGKKF